MSGFEPEFADQPSVARCLLESVLLVAGALILAAFMYFLVILAAVILGVVAVVFLGRIATRLLP